MTVESRNGAVDIRGLKSIARTLPRDHPLRITMEVEEDKMEVNEFLAKIRGWLKLLSLEYRSSLDINRTRLPRQTEA